MWNVALLISFVVDLDQAYFAVTSKGKKKPSDGYEEGIFAHSNF